MIYFLRGFIIETSNLNLSTNKTTHGNSFILAEEMEAYKEKIATEQYQTLNGSLYYRIHNGLFETINIKSHIAKTYVYKKEIDSIVYWNKNLPIERQFPNDILDMEDIIQEGE